MAIRPVQVKQPLVCITTVKELHNISNLEVSSNKHVRIDDLLELIADLHISINLQRPVLSVPEQR